MAEIALKLATLAGQKLVSELYDSIYGELSLLLTVREEVQYIIDELEIMSAFLREPEEKQASNQVARAWVKQVRQLSYTVEDCIDEFSLHLGQHAGNNLKARHRIAAQIQSIKARVQEVSNRRLRYGIVEMSKSQSSDECNVAQYDPQLAALFVEDGQLVGIDGPREKLVGWLMDEHERELRLIAVVGGGGLGKTTIVKKAYDQVTSTHFSCRAWITVSQVYHVEGILRDMIKQISPSPPWDLNKMPRQRLITTLISYLQDKRYVIVFDDLWKMDAWKSLESALPRNNQRSRVMLTTRNKEVAEACCSQIPGQTYEHKKLDDIQSMNLFCRRAFKNTDGTCPEELEKASQDLVRKCGGLPLAIVSIAGVLASKREKTIEGLKELLGRLGSELEGNPNLKEVDRILSLSYNDLPYDVKRCFLYLSRYPEDHLMRRKDVQRLWIAEGFAADRRDMAAEEVAESYFNELVNRFMILPSEFSVDGKVKTFRLHDVMLQLLVSKSREENFVTILGKEVRCPPQGAIRHLSFHSECNPKDGILSHVRSLSMFGEGNRPVSPSLRMLRVLEVYGYGGGDDDVLENVGKLLHLKCLTLRDRDGRRLPGSLGNLRKLESFTRLPESLGNLRKLETFTRLPESLGNLRNLETLDLRGSDVCKIPSGVTELQQLRVLHGGRSGSRFPRGIGNLRSLQVLTGVDLKESGHGAIKEIGKLTQLRKLGVSRLPRKWEDDFCKSLEAMRNSLRSLNIHGWGSYSQDEEPFLNNLSAPPGPPPTLRSLHLFSDRDWDSKLPSWVGSLHNAVKITLEGFPLDDRAVKVLGSLPSLMVLNVRTSHKVHNLSFGAAEGFRSLKRLSLPCHTEGSLSFKEGAMPHLESLDLEFNWRSGECVGLKNLPRLKEINVTAPINFLLALEAEIDGHPNHPRVIYRVV